MSLSSSLFLSCRLAILLLHNFKYFSVYPIFHSALIFFTSPTIRRLRVPCVAHACSFTKCSHICNISFMNTLCHPMHVGKEAMHQIGCLEMPKRAPAELTGSSPLKSNGSKSSTFYFLPNPHLGYEACHSGRLQVKLDHLGCS